MQCEVLEQQLVDLVVSVLERCDSEDYVDIRGGVTFWINFSQSNHFTKFIVGFLFLLLRPRCDVKF